MVLFYKTIRVVDLLEILKAQKRGTFANFHIETVPDMRKTENPFFGKVMKITTGNILIGGNYNKRVENETGIEGFQSEKCKVGEHIGDGNCVLYNENKGRHYLQYEWFEEVRPKSEYEFEGNPIEKELFRSYMGTYTPNKYGVLTQSVNVNNIKSITFNHTKYTVIDPIPDTPRPKVKKVKGTVMGQ